LQREKLGMKRKTWSIAVDAAAVPDASRVASDYAPPTLEDLGTVEDYTASIGISIIVTSPGGGQGVTVNGVEPAQVLGGASVNGANTPQVTLPVTT
jgi:hypothetical protein